MRSVSALRRPGVLSVMTVLVVLGGVYGVASLHHSVSLVAGSPPQQPRMAPVSSVIRACPAPGSVAGRGGGIAIMSAPGTGAAAAHGNPAAPASLVVDRLASLGGAVAGPLLTSRQPGSPVFAAVAADRAGRTQAAGNGTATKPANGAAASGAAQRTVPTVAALGGVVVQASGALAQGLEVEQTAGGLPTAACGSPGTDFWFTGPGQRTVGQITLYLMNPGSQAADASVDIFTDAGPLQGTTDTGITVPPHGMISQPLATALRHSRAVTLHVRTSVGQVVAAVQESSGRAAGTWLPAAQPPATRLVIPGLPAMPGSRQLFVAVPGLKDATIKVTAVTSRGSYQPTGASGIDLPAGSAAAISLPSLSGIPAALRLTANTPITAAVLVPGGAGGSPGSFTAATPAIEEQGVVADNVVGPARSSSLVLSAPLGAARVTVTQVTTARERSRPASQMVRVNARSSVVVQLHGVPGAPRGAPFALVVTPAAGSGPVYAGRVVTGNGAGGTLQALQPVTSALRTVPLPVVRNALITSVP